MSQNCIDCRWIWTGNQRCVECTNRILKKSEDEWRTKLFADFKPRGRLAPGKRWQS